MSIEIKNISHSYNKGTIQALKDVSLSIKPGERFGIIGPDGAGKTSLFRILTTLLLADSGSAVVCGYDVVKDYKAIRSISGYMPGKFSLYYDLSIQENLNFFARVFGTSFEANRHLVEEIYVQLEPFKDRPAGKLSGGMKQKLALCCALIHEPKVLFLDEPTTGVDPVSRREFWDMLDRLKSRNITILVSTPYMDEASRCDRIALMQDGKILAVDSLEGIIANYDKKLWSVKTQHTNAVLKKLKIHPEVASSIPFGDSIHIRMKNQLASLEDLRITMANMDESLTVAPLVPEIEDVFMDLMSAQ